MIRPLIRFYQFCISPALHFIAGPGGGCRFEPTCSRYFLEAVETHGSVKGCWLGLKRIVRCHPWGGSGFDPVPGKAGGDCRWVGSQVSVPSSRFNRQLERGCGAARPPASPRDSPPPPRRAAIAQSPNREITEIRPEFY